MVRLTLLVTCPFADCPIRRSPSSVNATKDGVVRSPCELAITSNRPSFSTATQELVVPRSMPITISLSEEGDSVEDMNA